MEQLYLWFKETLFYKDTVFRELILAILPLIADIMVAIFGFIVGRMTKKIDKGNKEQIDIIIEKYETLLSEKNQQIYRLEKENKKLKRKKNK